MIDPDEKVVVGSDVIFNEAADFGKKELDAEEDAKYFKYIIGDISEDHRVKTKKSLLYSSYWLPQYIQEEYFVKVIGIKVKEYREIEFDSYIINLELPDTAEFADKKLAFKIDPIKERELIQDLPYPNKGRWEVSENVKYIALFSRA